MIYQKLKNCPWCGRPTKLINYKDLYFVTCDDSVNEWMNCGRVVTVYYQSVEDAVKGWNEEETLNAIRIEDVMASMRGETRTSEYMKERAKVGRAFKQGLKDG